MRRRQKEETQGRGRGYGVDLDPKLDARNQDSTGRAAPGVTRLMRTSGGRGVPWKTLKSRCCLCCEDACYQHQAEGQSLRPLKQGRSGIVLDSGLPRDAGLKEAGVFGICSCCCLNTDRRNTGGLERVAGPAQSIKPRWCGAERALQEEWGPQGG